MTNSLDRSTTERIVLLPGESIELEFQAPPPPAGSTRMLLFYASGKYEEYGARAAIDALPNDYSFSQNYPNPFNPSTSFNFSLPEASEVTLEIFNIMGQKVATVVNMYLEAGSHDYDWNGRAVGGSEIASGVYFAKLTAGKFTAAKKMVVVK